MDSRAGCCFVKVQYCISFRCQSVLPVPGKSRPTLTSISFVEVWTSAATSPRALPPDFGLPAQTCEVAQVTAAAVDVSCGSRGSNRTFGYLGGILQLNTFGSVTAMVLDFLDLKGIVHPNNRSKKIHLYNTKEDIWKNFLYWKTNISPMLFGTQCSSNILFCVLQKQVIQEVCSHITL